jgi:YidC/Oxa1 family membrane protein insertase
MSGLWGAFLELFQVGLFWLTQFYGGHVASAIVSLSLLVRLMLLPVTVRLSLRARAHGRAVRALRPELDRVRERWADTPERMATETVAVYQRAGVSPVDVGVLRSSLLQTPIFIGLYHAVRGALTPGVGRRSFLWVADIARPDVGVAVLASVAAGISAWVGANENQPAWTLALPTVLTGAMALAISAGFGLYLLASGLVGTLQGLLVMRIEGRDGHA